MKKYDFHADILSKRNYEEIPKDLISDLDKFEAIKKLDSLCPEGSSIECLSIKKDLGYCIKAQSVHLVGNSLVVNRSFGWHPDFRTTIFCESEPNTDIVEKYGKFYCTEPEIINVSIARDGKAIFGLCC